jgi:hypothetical protein
MFANLCCLGSFHVLGAPHGIVRPASTGRCSVRFPGRPQGHADALCFPGASSQTRYKSGADCNDSMYQRASGDILLTSKGPVRKLGEGFGSGAGSEANQQHQSHHHNLPPCGSCEAEKSAPSGPQRSIRPGTGNSGADWMNVADGPPR